MKRSWVAVVHLYAETRQNRPMLPWRAIKVGALNFHSSAQCINVFIAVAAQFALLPPHPTPPSQLAVASAEVCALMLLVLQCGVQFCSESIRIVE